MRRAAFTPSTEKLSTSKPAAHACGPAAQRLRAVHPGPFGEGAAGYGLQIVSELLQCCSSSVRTALAIDVMRLGQRDLRKIRQDFRRATPRSTSARAAARARLRVLSVGVSSWRGLCLMPVVSHGPAHGKRDRPRSERSGARRFG